MKSPPVQHADDVAREEVGKFIAEQGRRAPKKAREQQPADA
jgi:hypothetical protein